MGEPRVGRQFGNGLVELAPAERIEKVASEDDPLALPTGQILFDEVFDSTVHCLPDVHAEAAAAEHELFGEKLAVDPGRARSGRVCFSLSWVISSPSAASTSAREMKVRRLSRPSSQRSTISTACSTFALGKVNAEVASLAQLGSCASRRLQRDRVQYEAFALSRGFLGLAGRMAVP